MGSPANKGSFATPAKGSAAKVSASSTLKSGAKGGAVGKTDSKIKVTAQDHEGSIDLTIGDNENSFGYSAQELMRRETINPTHNMEDI